MEEGADETAASSSGIAIYLEESSSSGTYSLSSSTKLPSALYTLNTSKSSCTNGGTVTQDSNTMKVSVNVTGSDYCTLYYYYCPNNTLACAVSKQADTETTPDFSTVATTDEGVLTAEDDYGTSYYFRGAVENNYVYFAGFYWRIVRVNGDGSVRLIYDGKSAYANGTSSIDKFISVSQFNKSYSCNAYVGYMYGTPCSSSYKEEHANVNDSTIKTVIDTWYENNLKDTIYESYLADAIFCNDRSLYSGDGYTSSSETYYSAYWRVYGSVIVPQFTCNQQHDAFTVSDTTYGNGDLTYPIGLITIDEVLFAGASYNTPNYDYYLTDSNYYQTMTPFAFNYDGTNPGILHARCWYLRPDTAVSAWYVTSNDKYAKPVINIKGSVIITSGNGESSSPYVLSLS